MMRIVPVMVLLLLTLGCGGRSATSPKGFTGQPSTMPKGMDAFVKPTAPQK
jgi:hypothetical protein